MIQLAALLCLALMTGNEFCVAVFVNPAMRGIPEAEQTPTQRATAAILGRAMPFWYAASLLLTWADWFIRRRDGLPALNGALVSGATQLAVLILTLAFMVPINNRLARLAPRAVGWLPEARRWDTLHRLRVGLLLIATLALPWL